MHTLPFETIGLSGDDVQTLEDTYSALKEKFKAGLPCDVEVPLDKFDFLCNNPHPIDLGGVVAIAHPTGNCYLAFTRIHFYYNSLRAGGEPQDYYKYQVWGFIKSKKDYGRLLIRRETFADRLLGLVHPVELDFKDDKAFSRKYYVVSNDAEKALLAISLNLRNAIMAIEEQDIVIEITDNMLLIGNNYYLDEEQAVYLAGIVSKIASVA